MVDLSFLIIIIREISELVTGSLIVYFPYILVFSSIICATFVGFGKHAKVKMNSEDTNWYFVLAKFCGFISTCIMVYLLYPHMLSLSGHLGISKQFMNASIISTFLLVTALTLFIISRFHPSIPNNNSMCNTRQKLTWTSYLFMLIFFFYGLYLVNFVVFHGTVYVIFFFTELFSVVFWFYDPILFLISQVIGVKRKPPHEATPGRTNRFAVIGCAHNEENVISELIKSLYATSYPKDMYDIFIICDNCSDSTADKVRDAGAIAMERHDLEHKGKGYGLKWMFEYLTKEASRGNVYDAYIVLDADNLVNETYLSAINDKLNDGHEILQTYLGAKNPKDTWVSTSYSYTYWVSNAVYQNAHSILSLSAQMGGTGMIIRPSVLDEIGWDTDSLTEDLVLTARYVLAKDKPCCWVHDAKLYDEKPLKLKPSIRQRTRWMQGHMAAMFKFAPKLILSGIRRMSLTKLDVAFYLCRPLINLFLFIAYGFRLYFNLFMADTMSIEFLMSSSTSILLILAYFILHLYVLNKEGYVRYFAAFIVQAIFSFTWYPAILRGLIKRKERFWVSTVHTRTISIEDVAEDKALIEAKRKLRGLDNIDKLPIGELLFKAAVISEDDIAKALQVQKQKGGLLGNILVENKAVGETEMLAYLSVQESMRDMPSSVEKHIYLGNIMIELGLIDKAGLESALEYQEVHTCMVGEALLALNLVSIETLDLVIEFQKIIISQKTTMDSLTNMLTMFRIQDCSVNGILLLGHIVSDEQFATAMTISDENDKSIEEVLIEQGFVKPETYEVFSKLVETCNMERGQVKWVSFY